MLRRKYRFIISATAVAVMLLTTAGIAGAQTITAAIYKEMSAESRQFSMSLVKGALLTGMVSLATSESATAEIAGASLADNPIYACLSLMPESELVTVVNAYLLDLREPQLLADISEVTVDALLNYCH